MRSYRHIEGATVDLAKLDRVTGALDPIFPAAFDSRALDAPARVLVPHGDALFVGGAFGYYDGSAWVSRAALIDPETGALR